MENEFKYLKLFKNVCKNINSSLELREVLDAIVENTVMMLRVKGCSIFLLDKTHHRLIIGASYGLSDAYLKKGPIDSEESIVESLNGTPVMVMDAQNDERIQYPEQAKAEGITSILSVPMSVRDKIIGVLRIYTSDLKEFSEAENEFISGLSEIGSIGIENARMHDHLKTDYDRLIADVHQWFDFGRRP